MTMVKHQDSNDVKSVEKLAPLNDELNMTSLNDSMNASRSQDDSSAVEAAHARYRYSSSHRLHQVASKTVVSFGPDDPDYPVNWSMKKKAFISVAGIMQVMNSTIGSSLPSGAIPYIAHDFHVTSHEGLVLPISLYIVGYVVGPLFFGPISEAYGRKVPQLIAFLLFNIFTMSCALTTSFTSLLILRLFCGIMASAPIAIVGGLLADIETDPTRRGRVMAYFMATTTFGPVVGPWVSGFVSPINWRLTFWIGLIIAVLTLPFVALMPETYAPVILQQRARRLRKEMGNASILAPLDLENRNLKATLVVNLTRPIRMIFHESIVSLTCLYTSLAYAIFYLYFQAYPMVFQGIYGMSAGVAGLCFLPIGLGSFISCGIFLWYDGFLARAKARGAEWAQIEEYRRLPLACVGGPLYVVSLFWLGWTASANIHWVAPMLSGVVFGIAYMLIFMAMLNYLSDAYAAFAASAQSAASCSRSIFGAVLPLAAKSMFDRLGIHWGCSVLAFVSLGLCVIPFAFIRYGSDIRKNSTFSQYLLQMREAEQRENEARKHDIELQAQAQAEARVQAVARAHMSIKADPAIIVIQTDEKDLEHMATCLRDSSSR
ncbi:hypothetical protein Egran_04529 [Elaphomyces granulatus]|uniref:Major facilitator superfamily (MFS) profile domain-containing protein n=1 Tax=Elaphomyces granulatus TaxID=519963 RepID=A0A232LUB3_9EURO|nr:hypothetical protein Egran_04529 [Elaphomyces granulatus]